jgi:Concanavalin A-like lectin/glucanases superfamily
MASPKRFSKKNFNVKKLPNSNAQYTQYSASYLVVGGGGSGGSRTGGGGGAGGVLTGTSTIIPSTVYTITIGGGGSGATPTNVGNYGGNSSFNSITAYGGGGGGTNGVAPPSGTWGSGGGGSSCAGTGPWTIGATGTPGQGNKGGCGSTAPRYGTGGGGGAGGAGSNGTACGIGGAGGVGANTSLITASIATLAAVGQVATSNVVFGGGGGGGIYLNPAPAAPGGLGGGGSGGNGATPSTNATTNTGGGGGGQGNNSATNSGSGGSGTVIVSYPSSIQKGVGGITLNNGANTTGSVFFNSTSQYLYLSGPAGLTLGSNNFTIESWINFSSSSGIIIIDFRPSSTNGFYPQFSISSSGNLSTYVNGSNQIVGNTSLSASTWYHVAWVRNNGTSTLYVNGSSVGSTADTNSYSVGSSRPVIATNGYQTGLSAFPGYISNLRIVNGTAVYTGNFTPPRSQLTAIANTVLLMCQDSSGSTFHDNGPNNYTISNSGPPAISNTQPIQLTNAGIVGSNLSGGFATANANTYYHIFTSSGTYTG